MLLKERKFSQEGIIFLLKMLTQIKAVSFINKIIQQEEIMKAKSNTRDLSPAEVDTFLREQKVGMLSLTDGQYPYAIPLAYSYDNNAIYLTLGPQGKKMEYIGKNRNACFAVYWIPQEYGKGSGSWKSVICDGDIEQLTAPEEVKKAVRVLEKHMGMPHGALDKILEMQLKNPKASNFWRVNVKSSKGRGVENFQEEFSE